MNGIFPADVAVYLLLLPIAVYVFKEHRWAGCLPWYYMIIFCAARIAGGALGIHDSSSMAANIIQSVAITPLILGVDGLTHEARTYRYPSRYSTLNWTIVGGTSAAMIAAIALSISGAINIFKEKGTTSDYAFWKAGTALTVAVWGFQVCWAIYSILSRESQAKSNDDGPGYRGSTMLLQGGLVALLFIGIRVIYTLVAVVTRRRDLSLVYGTLAVRVVLMFLPEVFAAGVMIAVGVKTRHLRALERENRL